MSSLFKQTKKRKVNVKSELDRYLDDDPLPDSDWFDILNFWKSDLQYPTLRSIARDILAIPASTVASESTFSTGGRVIGSFDNNNCLKTIYDEEEVDGENGSSNDVDAMVGELMDEVDNDLEDWMTDLIN